MQVDAGAPVHTGTPHCGPTCGRAACSCLSNELLRPPSLTRTESGFGTATTSADVWRETGRHGKSTEYKVFAPELYYTVNTEFKPIL